MVRSLSQEEGQEKEMATHSNILPGKSHRQRSLRDYSPWSHERDGYNLATTTRKRQQHNQNQDTDMDTTQRTHSDFTSFTSTCVCVCVCTHMCVCMQLCVTNQDTTPYLHKTPSGYPLLGTPITHSHH